MRVFVAGIITIFCSVGAALAEPVPADVTKFELSGIRLYMSADEAIKALKTKYGKNIRLSTYSVPSEFHPEKKELSVISFKDDASSVTVLLSSRLPDEPGPAGVVVSVKYELQSTTKADRDQLMQSALAKYGTPTWGPEFNSAEWCGPVIKRAWPGAHSCHDVPLLTVNREYITMSDTGYSEKVRAAKEQMHTVKSKF